MDSFNMLRNELNKLGFLRNIQTIMGRSLIFGDDSNHIICGIVTSIGYGPDEGLSFRVSSPKFCGHDIDRIVPLKNRQAKHYSGQNLISTGEFEIL